MKALIYDFWDYIMAFSVMIGIISAIIDIKCFINGDGNSSSGSDGNTGTVKKIIFSILSAGFFALAIFAWLFQKQNTVVPPVTHMSMDNAQQTLIDNDLSMELAPGQEYILNKEITSQDPAAGEVVKKGSKVICKYDDSQHEAASSSDSIPAGVVKVPDVIDMEQSEAGDVIHQSDLEFKVWWTNDGTFFDNEYCYVIEQDLAPGTEVEAGSIVNLRLTGKRPNEVKHTAAEKDLNDTGKEYFIVFDDDVMVPTKINTKTDEVSYPDPDEIADEEMVHAFINLHVKGASTGVLLATDDGLPSFYITPGTYEVSADFGNDTKSAQLDIVESGDYTLVFE